MYSAIVKLIPYQHFIDNVKTMKSNVREKFDNFRLSSRIHDSAILAGPLVCSRLLWVRGTHAERAWVYNLLVGIGSSIRIIDYGGDRRRGK